MLRILSIPRIHTTHKITGCSGFNAQRWVFEELGRKGRTATEIWLPRGLEYGSAPTDEVNVKYTEGTRTWKKITKADSIETDDELIAKFHGKKFTVDACVTDYQFSIPYHDVIQYEVDFGMNIPETFPIVTWANEGYDAQQYYRRPTSYPLLGLAQMAGGLMFCTVEGKKRVLAELRKIFKPAFIEKVMNAPLVGACIDTSSTDFDAIYEKNIERRKASNGPITMFNANVPAKDNRYDVLMECLDSAVSIGSNLRMRYCTPLEKIPDVFERGYVEARTGVDRSTLIGMLHESDLLFEGTILSGTALSLWEGILAGSIPLIFRDKKMTRWIDGRINDDYPYVVDNKKDMIAMMKYMSLNAGSDEVIAEQKKLRDFVYSKVGQGPCSDIWAEEIGKVIASRCDYSKYRKSIFGDVMLSAREKWDEQEMTSSQAGKLAADCSRNGQLNPKKILSGIAFRRLMQSCGFVDVGTMDEEKWAIGWEEWATQDMKDSLV